ncbi:hypothetical protein B5V01_30255 [Mesorhizobium erdmanii]|uniref:Uncharacterized protein n=2 Tax=Mesorhizobium TaxID=68287 RepID=A0A3M9X9G9_9HYPH|nr:MULTISPECIES: hypothetical protein [Mesorhizobium]RNJ44346.1 hypothetical protein DNR46_17015 [Mesorhizobium japonicum]RXT36316.1 hypothetical protein B5V01_30255 [Mesorhizobium erdmanii]
MGIYLDLTQLEGLLEPPDRTVAVGYMPASSAAHLGCSLGIAYLSSTSLRHILQDHPDITLIDLVCLTSMLHDGLWIADRPKHAVVVYNPPETDKRYKAAIKVTAGGFEPYVCTFHRFGDRQLESLLKRGRILWEGCGGWR